MYIDKKQNQYWLWSSKKASLDCMPWYKADSMMEIQAKYFKKMIALKNKRARIHINFLKVSYGS